MSFWESASGGTKATVIGGGILIVVLLGMMLGKVGPFSTDLAGEETTQQRGFGN